jgi:asparagine N-glycosylation enzyme membrane subunit Stt3
MFFRHLIVILLLLLLLLLLSEKRENTEERGGSFSMKVYCVYSSLLEASDLIFQQYCIKSFSSGVLNSVIYVIAAAAAAAVEPLFEVEFP